MPETEFAYPVIPPVRHSGRHKRLTGKAKLAQAAGHGTFDALIAAYRASPDFFCKAERTKVLNERHMRIIADAWGPLQVRGLKPRHVLQLRDKLSDRPRMADQVVSLLSAIISWGIPRDFCDSNPCREIRKLARSEGYSAWSWADISYAREHLPEHLWWAVALALYTGQRQADVIQMTWNRLVDGVIELRQGKTGKRLGCRCTAICA